MKEKNNTKNVTINRAFLASLLVLLVLSFAPQVFSKDWKKAISQFQIQNFSIPLKEVESLSAEEAKKKIYNDYIKYVFKLSEDYKASLGVDYTPFIGAFQQTAVKDFIDKFETIDSNAIAAIVDKVNSGIKYDFFYFKEYDFGLSMHQLYDLKVAVEAQKNEIIHLNAQVSTLQKEQMLSKVIAFLAILLSLFLLFSFQKIKGNRSVQNPPKAKA